MGYDNLAYALDNEAYEIEVNAKRRKANQAKQQEIRKNRTLIVCYVMMLLLAAVFMICKNISEYEGEIEIKKLEKEKAEIMSYISQKTFELEENVDLNTVEEIASSRLGMQRPTKNQTVYVNIKREDVCELTSKEVEGVKHRMQKTASGIKQNVIGSFSLR